MSAALMRKVQLAYVNVGFRVRVLAQCWRGAAGRETVMPQERPPGLRVHAGGREGGKEEGGKERGREGAREGGKEGARSHESGLVRSLSPPP